MADDMALMWDEVTDIGALLHDLDDDEFDSPSLCAGWAVRDVLGHMATGHTVPLASIMASAVKHGFNVTKTSYEDSKRFFAGKSPVEIRTFWDDVMIGQRPRKGISRTVPGKVAFLDHLTHNQDIRRPTGRQRQIPEARAVRALELMGTVNTPLWKPKKHIAGLRLEATDVGWATGDGPAVEGPAEAILLAAAGRPAALADLQGDGVETLKRRIGG
jgi:uncharacterized protein (TIGR03083 family)